MTLAVAAAAAVLVSLAGMMLISGEACKNVPSMTLADACLNLPNTTERRHELCRNMLQIAPASAEATVYAVLAAQQASLRFRDAAAEMDQMLNTGGNPPAGEAAKLEHCRDKYGEAGRLMGAVADQLLACELSRVIRLRKEYIHAQLAIRSCQDVCRGMPCFDTISVDIDVIMVAYSLGAMQGRPWDFEGPGRDKKSGPF